jgi:hypothetical protein
MKSYLMLSIALGLAACAPAGMAATRPVVVELFTSQGCSSCPPADAVLTELAARPNVIALGFHVDYWDHLGWKDPLSAPGSTERQNDYAARFGRREIYTPQLVVDGKRQLVGSHRADVLLAVDQAKPEATVAVSIAADRASVTVGAGAGAGTVTLIRFARSRSTTIRRGENAGTEARDVNGVDQLLTLGEWTGAPQRFAIDPPDAEHGLAVLVQAENGAILGAAALSANGG